VQDTLANLVRERAGHACEYCRLPQALSCIPFEIDHIIAQKHKGATAADNLALACFYCNSFKGPNVAGVDPATKAVTPLFHPRREIWAAHFRWQGAVLVGLTAAGRTTIEVLGINSPDCVLLRESLIHEGQFPPTAASPTS
jgi:hypothetical protein